MRTIVFSTKDYERPFFDRINSEFGHDLTFLEARLSGETAALAAGFPAVCAFVNDDLDAGVLLELAGAGTKLIALRSAGFNNVDLHAAARLGVTVVRVPAYSPHAVAEHTIALILALNRKLYKAYNRVREANFSLDGLLGFDLNGRTAGVVGTGKIGVVAGRILAGFGCAVIASDPMENPAAIAAGMRYVPLRQLLETSDVITLHCPLLPSTRHLINDEAVARMKSGAMLINTSRGALIDTNAVISGLKSGRIGALGLDVYEEEADLFFEDLSGAVLQDDVFARLLTFPNVLITGHQAFFTREALENIIRTTLANIRVVEETASSPNEVKSDRVVR